VNADIVGVSALLTTTMTGQRTVITTLAEAGLRPKVKVMVGARPSPAPGRMRLVRMVTARMPSARSKWPKS